MKLSLAAFALFIICNSLVDAADEVTIHLDASEVPEQQVWAEEGQRILAAWHPRIVNLLSSGDFTAPTTLSLELKRSEKGIAASSGTKIVVFSNWIEKRPEDFGLLVHELVHVIQRYPRKEPEWVTEGIADYIRWAIYEGMGQTGFHVPQAPDGYKEGYQAAAGFLLWLETHDAPGIVRRLNTAMRSSSYTDAVFADMTGRDLGTLWTEYVKSRRKVGGDEQATWIGSGLAD